MYDPGAGENAAEPFPLIRATLARKSTVIWSGTILVLLLGIWVGVRMALWDVFVVAVFAAVIVHFILKVAIEVIGLVAETLMPR